MGDEESQMAYSHVIVQDPETKVRTIPMIADTELVLASLQPSFRLSVSTDTRQMHNPVQILAVSMQELHDSFIILMLTYEASSDGVADCPKCPAETLAGRTSQATSLVKKSPFEVTRRSNRQRTCTSSGRYLGATHHLFILGTRLTSRPEARNVMRSAGVSDISLEMEALPKPRLTLNP